MTEAVVGLIQRSLSSLAFTSGRSLPLIMQAERSECGLACLAMVASYHGRPTTIGEVRAMSSASSHGHSVAELAGIGQRLDLTARIVKLEVDELPQLKLPCLIHWDMNHFVVLKSVGRNSIVVHDPAFGVRRIALSEVRERFTGIAMECIRSPNFKKKAPIPRIPLRTLIGPIFGAKNQLIRIASVSIFLELASLFVPKFTELTVDQVLSDGDEHLLTIIGLGFAFLVMAQAIFSAVRTWMTAWLGSQFSTAWTGYSFSKLMRLPPNYFMSRHLGEIVSRFGAIGVIQQTVTGQAIAALMDGVMTFVTLGMLLAYSPVLSAIACMGTLAYVVLRMLYFRVYRDTNLGQVVLSAKQQTMFLESVRGIQALKLHGRESAQTSSYLNKVVDTANATVRIQKLGMVFDASEAILAGFQRVAILWLGATLVLAGKMSAGMLLAFMGYSEQFSGRAIKAFDCLMQFRLLPMQAERLADIVASDSEVGLSSDEAVMPVNGVLELRNVSYRHSKDSPWILKNCSLAVDPGTALAIVGPSGAGKTTLMRIFLGLIEPSEGSVCLGGVDIRRFGKDRWRALTGVVMQDDDLFSGTLEQNITMFSEHVDRERLMRCALAAQVHEDISRFPLGYSTRVGDMGSTLSGGQRQRVLLARALYRQPEFLFLDEATSHVDLSCEKCIADQLAQLSMTRVSIAHRPQTIELADRVLHLDDGRLTEIRRLAAVAS